MWFLFALLSSFCQATGQALAKKYQTENNYIILAAVSYLIGAIALFTTSLIKGIPLIGPSFWSAVIVESVLNILGAIYFYKSLRLTDLSLAAPMLAFTPVFLILIGYLVLGEKPNLFGFLGIVSVVLGIFFINSPKISKFFHAIHSIKNDKGILLMLFVSFLYACIAAFDKVITLNSDFVFGVAWTTLFTAIFFISYSFISFKKQAFSLYRKYLQGSVLIGISSAISNVSMNFAYLYTLAAYAISVKRLSVLIGVFYGIILFKEPETRRRLIGAIIAVMGVALIAFS
jgi:drug/metabolite transporter (DMT)-like permease